MTIVVKLSELKIEVFPENGFNKLHSLTAMKYKLHMETFNEDTQNAVACFWSFFVLLGVFLFGWLYFGVFYTDSLERELMDLHILF